MTDAENAKILNNKLLTWHFWHACVCVLCYLYSGLQLLWLLWLRHQTSCHGLARVLRAHRLERHRNIFNTDKQTHSIHIHNKYIMQNVSVLKGFLKLQFLQFLWDWSFLFFMLTYMHAHTHPHTQTWLLMDDRRWEVFSIAEADWRGGVLCSACSFVWVATHTNKTFF